MKMKKNTEDNQKTLSWRLSELPTAGEVAELVDAEVITKEEAREILFKKESSKDEKVKALEEQVEFLKGLVEQLAKNRTVWPPFSYAVTTPKVYWANTDKFLTQNGFMSTLETHSGKSGGIMSVSLGKLDS